ncbi:MAG: zinc-binding dehydrogenase [Acidipropionibacterium sp.]|jgi:threonine dehydrogenase-like Zn-dependent dehydrogenase|nr:zinc-binding dehydrogenase [Acidipropionibacterium sp.]
MKTISVNLHGKMDLRLESKELPRITEDEILAEIVTDTMCMSSWKLVKEGENHKKTPDDLAENPIMIGHEFSGRIVEVGARWADRFEPGQRIIVQPNLARENTPFVPGYSYPYVGGDATFVIIPPEVMELDCLIPFEGQAYYEGSLCEPLSCVIATFESQFHLIPHTYQPEMGIKDGGSCLILAGTGPMGLLAVDYALHGDRRPRTLVVTGRDDAKLDRARRLYPSDEVDVHFLNVNGMSVTEQQAALAKLGGGGFDDVICMVSVSELVAMAGELLNPNGCLNQFAGPMDKSFTAPLNFYDVHYNFTHVTGTSGGNAADAAKAARLIAERKVDVAKVITHVLGLDSAAETTLNQPTIGGGKKLTYTHKSFERIELATVDPASPLGRILAAHDGIWSPEAERWILANQPDIAVEG